jgi:hypothetical protein
VSYTLEATSDPVCCVGGEKSGYNASSKCPASCDIIGGKVLLSLSLELIVDPKRLVGGLANGLLSRGANGSFDLGTINKYMGSPQGALYPKVCVSGIGSQ